MAKPGEHATMLLFVFQHISRIDYSCPVSSVADSNNGNDQCYNKGNNEINMLKSK